MKTRSCLPGCSCALAAGPRLPRRALAAPAQPAGGLPRHRAGRPPRRLRRTGRHHPESRPAGPRRRPLLRRLLGGAAHPAFPRHPDDRPPAAAARPAGQRRRPAAGRAADPGRAAGGRRLRYRRLRRRLRARPPLRPGPRLRALRRRGGRAPSGRGSPSRGRAAGRRGGRRALAWLETASPAGPRNPSSSSCTSTMPTRPTGRRSPGAAVSPIAPTTARSPSPTSSWGGSWPGSRPAASSARTLVAVVADHGESLGEHGEDTHGLLLYEPALHVPLLLRAPGRVPAGGVVDAESGLADLAPTLASLLGQSWPAGPASRRDGDDGRDLAPLLRGESLPPPGGLRRDRIPGDFRLEPAGGRPPGRQEADPLAAPRAFRPGRRPRRDPRPQGRRAPQRRPAAKKRPPASGRRRGRRRPARSTPSRAEAGFPRLRRARRRARPSASSARAPTRSTAWPTSGAGKRSRTKPRAQPRRPGGPRGGRGARRRWSPPTPATRSSAPAWRGSPASSARPSWRSRSTARPWPTRRTIADAWQDLAAAFHELGQHRESAAAASQALALDPRRPEALVLLALAELARRAAREGRGAPPGGARARPEKRLPPSVNLGNLRRGRRRSRRRRSRLPPARSRLAPGLADALNGLGALLDRGRPAGRGAASLRAGGGARGRASPRPASTSASPPSWPATRPAGAGHLARSGEAHRGQPRYAAERQAALKLLDLQHP